MLQPIYLSDAAMQRTNVFRRRRLPFSGAKNFRDLGGYPTADGRTDRWGLLYRSGALHKLTHADLRSLSALGLERIVDFRSTYEKDQEPDRLPEELRARLVHIPILDASTGLFQNSRQEFIKLLPTIDAAHFVITTNIDLGTRFTPEVRQFIDLLLASNGRPLLFHCAAGKDRTGFIAAILLQILGVPHELVMEDYLLTNQYFLSVYRWSLRLMQLVKGRRFAETVRTFMVAEPAYLRAAFTAIDATYGSFDRYVSDGLGLTETDTVRLRSFYLE